MGTLVDGGGNLSWPDSSCPGLNQDPKLSPLAKNGGSYTRRWRCRPAARLSTTPSGQLPANRPARLAAVVGRAMR